ncbi:MAG TPA: hypothetical protein DCX54_11630 [Flavobacteriales bacterium]|nr:hypothetical protein [Flavobacteriales bacterium]
MLRRSYNFQTQATVAPAPQFISESENKNGKPYLEKFRLRNQGYEGREYLVALVEALGKKIIGKYKGLINLPRLLGRF